MPVSARASPRRNKFVAGHVGRAGLFGPQQAPVDQVKHSVLRASLGEAGAFGQLSMADARQARLGRGKKREVDQESRCSAIVTHQVAHQGVKDVSVQCILLVAHRYGN